MDLVSKSSVGTFHSHDNLIVSELAAVKAHKEDKIIDIDLEQAYR